MSARLAVRLTRSTGFALDVDVDLPEGGTTVLFGPSGCGKTTLLRCAAGLERAAGVVRLGGRTWQDDETGCFVPTHRRDLGYVFQEAALFAHLSVRENLLFGAKRTRRDASAALDEAVALLGIGHLLQSVPARLSGGERQRVAIARAVAMRPSVLLLDEPLSALDHARKAEILPWLEKLKRELALPMLYVTHAVPELLRLADHVVVMRDGGVSAQGSVTDPDVWAAAGLGRRLPSAVLQGRVRRCDDGVAVVAAGSTALSVSGVALEPGAVVRLEVEARDVSLALTQHADTSISNILPALVEGLDVQPGGEVVVTLSAAGFRLYAAVSKPSVEKLCLKNGLRLFAQVKAVAVHG